MENEDKVSNIDFRKPNQYHLIEDKWYELALSQGEGCLAQLHSNIDSVTSKVQWLVGIEFTVVGAFASFAVLIHDKDPVPIYITLLCIGILPNLGFFTSILICISAIWLVSMPVAGSSPDLLFEEPLVEANQHLQYKSAAYKRAKDLCISIGRVKDELDRKSRKFTLAFQLAVVSMVVYIFSSLVAIFCTMVV
jgi:hypothetical protein